MSEKGCFKWSNIFVEIYTAWSSKGYVLGPVLFLIYINDLPYRIELICEIFAHDTPLFSKVKDETFSDTHLSNDLNKISKRAFQWKIWFNPDPRKQATETCFSQKHDIKSYPVMVFNDTKV